MQSFRWAFMIVATLIAVFAIISTADGTPALAQRPAVRPKPAVGKHRAGR